MNHVSVDPCSTPDAFDALLTDLRMPGMCGDMLIREVRSLRPLLPIILVSGYEGRRRRGGSSAARAPRSQ
jgi:CheY-like chemotaxis protein